MDDADKPKTWKKVLRSQHWDKWLAAAQEEFKSLLGMDMWRLVPRPMKHKIIKLKWVFIIQHRVDKSVLKMKAQLAVMGYSQVKVEDYEDVFSPTLCMEVFCLMFTLLASRGWAGKHLDL